MKHLKKYKEFKEVLLIDLGSITASILEESMNIWTDILLDSIKAEEVNLFDTLKLPKNFYNDKLTLEFLSENVEFINSLSSIALKKSQIQNTDDFECFIDKPLKFMFLYDINYNELQNPEYVILQTWNKTLEKWNDIKLYKINDDINKFYSKLGSKSIEVIDNDDKYIYQTSNKNEWILQNDKENSKFKKYFRKEEFDKFLSNNKFKISII